MLLLVFIVRAARVVSLVVIVMALVAGIAVWVSGPLSWVGARPAGVEVGVRLDVLSVLLLALVAGVMVLVASYSIRNLAGRAGTSSFGWLLISALTSLVVMVTGASLPVVAAGWTASGLLLASLVGHSGTVSAQRAARHVRRRLLMGDTAIWLAVAAGMLLLPTLNRSDLAGTDLPMWPSLVVAGLLVAGCLVRSALVPAQSWLVETAEAPSPVSALLHAGMVNGAGVMVALFWALFAATPLALLALLVVGAASVAVGALTTCVRTDVKGRLAGSTSTQMGYMAVQLGLGLPAAAVAHLVGHGCYKAWLFLRAGGAVTRARRAPVDAPEPAGAGSRGPLRPGRRHQDEVLVVSATVLAAGGAVPAMIVAVGSLGPAALLPVCTALATLVVALRAAGRRGSDASTSATFGSQARLGAAAVVAVIVYAWALVAFESALAPSLPLVPVWSVPVSLILLMGVGGAAAVVAVLLRRVLAAPTGRLASRLALSALPPWSRRLGVPVRWPATVTGFDVPDPVDQVDLTPLVHTQSDRVLAGQDCARVLRAVQVATMCVAPAWPLRSMVAANPLAGFEGYAHEDAAALSARLHGTRGYLPLSSYRQLHLDGRITRGQLLEALRQLGHERGEFPDPGHDGNRVDRLLQQAEQEGSEPRPMAGRPRRDLRLVDRIHLDISHVDQGGSGRAGARTFVDGHAALWCAHAWSRALREEPGGPWGVWRAAAGDPAHDRRVGMPGLHRIVQNLPEDPYTALAELLRRGGLDPSAHVSYLSALLSSAPGWAAHAAWRAREISDTTPVVQLLALRAALDVLVARAIDPSVVESQGHSSGRGDDDAVTGALTVDITRNDCDGRQAEVVWQRAYELGFRDALVTALRPAASRLAMPTPQAVPLPDAQLVFCIDVRSERMRRAVEATGAYETFGFAGFFGVALRYTTPEGPSFDQCPALIRPTFEVSTRAPEPGGSTVGLTRAPGLAGALSAVHASPLTALLVAEAGGGVTAAAAIARTFFPARWHGLVHRWHRGQNRWGPAHLIEPLSLEQRVEIAHDVLRGMGLVSGFARLLVVCGHGATLENNAFASAYDCGACGGNSGHVNARVLASILNDPAVRERLGARGIRIPVDTTAVAAVHDTTTDEVTFNPFAQTGEGGDAPDLLAQLRDDLARAGNAVRTERSGSLPGAPAPRPQGLSQGPREGTRPGTLLRHFRARAGDWAQPCPEWGLAGNAAFVIGPRALTQDLDLQGRVFLHDYDPALDHDDSILTTILTAPAVVTQWINAQYYASTVDHEVFGAGDKATHNVVGDVGVLSGAHGDLRLGLPWQALFTADPNHHPDRAQHEPLRQLVVVWAPPERVHRILHTSPALHSLLRNEWMSLAAIDPSSGTVHRLTPQMSWCDWRAEVPVPLGRTTASGSTSASTGSTAGAATARPAASPWPTPPSRPRSP